VVSFKARLLYSGERARRTLWIGGCVGLRAGLNNVEKGEEKMFLLVPGIELRSSS
jgi:hypothetical protein